MQKIQPLFILLSLTLTACGTASVLQRDPAGGTVALRGGYMAAMRDAQVLMADACKGHFDVRELQHGVSFHCRAKSGPRAALVTLAQR